MPKKTNKNQFIEGKISNCANYLCSNSCCNDDFVIEWVNEYFLFHERIKKRLIECGIKIQFKGDRVFFRNCSNGKVCKFLKYSFNKNVDPRPIDCKIYPYAVDWDSIDFDDKIIHVYYWDDECPLVTKKIIPEKFTKEVEHILKRNFAAMFNGAIFSVNFTNKILEDKYYVQLKKIRIKNALIIHGTEGYPEENWFPWLKKQLEKCGYQVAVPQFPTPENQTPEHWFSILKPYEKKFNEETILIGHSGGGAFLLRVLEKIPTKIKAAVFVAASAGIKPIKYYEADRPFVEKPFNWEKIRNSAEHFFVFHSEDDPLICLGNGEKIAQKVGTDLIKLKDAGHFNTKAGYTTFELLVEKLKPIL